MAQNFARTSGSGGIAGPVSSTDNAVVRWDTTTGAIIQDSGVIIDDSNNLTGAASLAMGTGELTAGSINRASGSLTLEIGGVAQQTITTTETTFNTFPVTPSAAPDADYEVANKKYVDDQILTTDTWDEVMHNGNTFTVANTENLSTTINQNDITNNPAALVITNTGSGNDITTPSFSLIAGALTGTSFTDGTATLTGGNLTGMGNITGTDVDISAGTGDYSSSGTVIVSGLIKTSSDMNIYGTNSGSAASRFSLNMSTNTNGQVLINGPDVGTTATFGLKLTNSAGSGNEEFTLTATAATFGTTIDSGAITSTGAVEGTSLTDGTATLTGGNLTGMGNITGTDVDISAGTGAYTSSGTLGAGAITGTSFTDSTMTITGGAASTLTFNMASNTLTGTKAQFDTACSDGSFAYSGGAFHDGFSDFVAEEHILHSGVTITAGAGLTGGGTISATRTLDVGAGTGIAVNANDVALSHLGLESLADPGADRIFFWDDGETASKWLAVSTGLTLSGTSLTTNDGEIDHNSLNNYVANEHIDWTNASDNFLTSGTIKGTSDIAAFGTNSGSVASRFSFNMSTGTNGQILINGPDVGTTATFGLKLTNSAGSGNEEFTLTATTATFGTNIIIPNDGTIGSAATPAAMTIASTGIVTFVEDIIPGTTEVRDIGSTSATWRKLYLADDLNNIFISGTSGDAVTTADSNVIIVAGGTGGAALTEGDDNVIIGKGDHALTTGNSNVFLGPEAGKNIETSSHSIMIGAQAGINAAVDAANNIFLGRQTGNNEASSGNIYIGYRAGYQRDGNTNAGDNVFIGTSAGNDSGDCDKCVYIGYNAGKSKTDDNRLYIENSDSASPLIFGIFQNDAAGPALTFNADTVTIAGDIVIADAGTIGSASDPDAIAIAADGKTTFTQDLTVNEDIIIGDSKYIGSATAPTAIQIASTGTIAMTGALGVAGITTCKDILELEHAFLFDTVGRANFGAGAVDAAGAIAAKDAVDATTRIILEPATNLDWYEFQDMEDGQTVVVYNNSSSLGANIVNSGGTTGDFVIPSLESVYMTYDSTEGWMPCGV